MRYVLLCMLGCCWLCTSAAFAEIQVYTTELYTLTVDTEAHCFVSIDYMVRREWLKAIGAPRDGGFYTTPKHNAWSLEQADYRKNKLYDIGHAYAHRLCANSPHERCCWDTAACFPQHFKFNRGVFSSYEAELYDYVYLHGLAQVTIKLQLSNKPRKFPFADEPVNVPIAVYVRVMGSGDTFFYSFSNDEHNPELFRCRGWQPAIWTLLP